MTREGTIAEYYKGERGNDFTEWLVDLMAVAIESYGFPFNVVEASGPECWYDYFEEGLTPETALLKEMRQDGIRDRKNRTIEHLE